MTAPISTMLPRPSATFLRYVAVGVVSFVVDAGTLWLLYEPAGAPLWVATTGGFWLSFAVNFTLNKLFTFGVRQGVGGQLVRYCVLVGVNYLANLGIVTGLVAVGVPALLAKTVAVGLLTVVNYFAYRIWIFRD